MLSSGMTLVTSAASSASTMAPSSSAVLTSVTPALQAKVLPQQIQGDDSSQPFTGLLSEAGLLVVEVVDFSSPARILGECSINHSPLVCFFFFFF